MSALLLCRTYFAGHAICKSILPQVRARSNPGILAVRCASLVAVMVMMPVVAVVGPTPTGSVVRGAVIRIGIIMDVRMSVVPVGIIVQVGRICGVAGRK